MGTIRRYAIIPNRGPAFRSTAVDEQSKQFNELMPHGKPGERLAEGRPSSKLDRSRDEGRK